MAQPKKYSISLSDEALKTLKSVLRKKSSSKTIRSRCQILIDLGEFHGKILTHEQSTKSSGVCMATITNTVKLYIESGIDNLNTHRASSLYKAYPPNEARRIIKCLEIQYTPKHGSWLDMAEIELNVMTCQCSSRRIKTLEKLKEELKE